MIKRLKREDGFTLPELLTVMAILSIVMAGLTQMMVSGSQAETDMNNRFRAQQAGRLALDKIRKDIHCASSAQVTTTSNTAQVWLQPLSGSTCGDVTWCTALTSGSTTKWTLYRQAASQTCSSSTGTKLAQYLTISNPFTTYTAQSTSSLASLSVDFPVRVNTQHGLYELKDTIYLLNSLRQ